MTINALELKADFIKDYIDHTKKVMANDGYDVSSIPDDEILMYFHNTIQKKPITRVRKLHVSDVFTCPSTLQDGWKNLSEKVINGEDFSVHLSRNISDVLVHDSLLNDWSVYHFHLGNQIDSKTGFITRTGPLLFALVTQDAFYAINVYAHGQWAEPDIIETVHRNWPETIQHARINGSTLSNNIDAKKRIALRRKNVNSTITTSDGTTYIAIGGGSTTSGMGLRAVRWSDQQYDSLKSVQDALKLKLPGIVATFESYSGEKEISATLEITESGPRVFFPEFGEHRNLKLTP